MPPDFGPLHCAPEFLSGGVQPCKVQGCFPCQRCSLDCRAPLLQGAFLGLCMQRGRGQEYRDDPGSG